MDPRSPVTLPFGAADAYPSAGDCQPAVVGRPRGGRAEGPLAVSANNFTVSGRHLAREENRAEAAQLLSPFAMQMAIVLAGSALMALFLWLTVERLAATERLLASCGV
jgi:hypothetical protein